MLLTSTVHGNLNGGVPRSYVESFHLIIVLKTETRSVASRQVSIFVAEFSFPKDAKDVTNFLQIILVLI